MSNLALFQTVTPSNMLRAIFLSAYSNLAIMRKDEIRINSAILNTSLDPASLLNGTINYRLPLVEEWTLAYQSDKDYSLMITMLKDPSTLTNENIAKVHFIYRAQLRQALITLEDGKLIFNEPTVIQSRSIKLIIVPIDLRKHVLHCFHTNPLGSHFGLYQTLHCIRLRFHWPWLFKYIKNMIQSCLACILKNGAARTSSELLYTFPLDAPMNTIHVDFWQPGKNHGFEGESGIMDVVCHMTTFAAIEPIKTADSTSFAKAVYKIMMRY